MIQVNKSPSRLPERSAGVLAPAEMTQKARAVIRGCQAEAGAQLCPPSAVFAGCLGNLCSNRRRSAQTIGSAVCRHLGVWSCVVVEPPPAGWWAPRAAAMQRLQASQKRWDSLKKESVTCLAAWEPASCTLELKGRQAPLVLVLG